MFKQVETYLFNLMLAERADIAIVIYERAPCKPMLQTL